VKNSEGFGDGMDEEDKVEVKCEEEEKGEMDGVECEVDKGGQVGSRQVKEESSSESQKERDSPIDTSQLLKQFSSSKTSNN
jgi:hypothetical protein